MLTQPPAVTCACPHFAPARATCCSTRSPSELKHLSVRIKGSSTSTDAPPSRAPPQPGIMTIWSPPASSRHRHSRTTQHVPHCARQPTDASQCCRTPSCSLCTDASPLFARAPCPARSPPATPWDQTHTRPPAPPQTRRRPPRTVAKVARHTAPSRAPTPAQSPAATLRSVHPIHATNQRARRQLLPPATDPFSSFTPASFTTSTQCAQ